MMGNSNCRMQSAKCRLILQSAICNLQSEIPRSFVILCLASLAFSTGLAASHSSLTAPHSPLPTHYPLLLSRADSLYHGQHYVRALWVYEAAHELAPDEPGPRNGIGWTLLNLGFFYEAETTFRRVPPERSEIARQGLAALPEDRQFKLTAGALAVPGFLVWSWFAEYNARFRTTLTMGIQGVYRSDWQGFNSGAVVFHRLDYQNALRLDFYGLGAFNKPRYWQVVYAPSYVRYFDYHIWSRLAFVGWDKLRVYGAQLETGRDWQSGLRLKLSPAVNRSDSGFGWWVPVSAGYRVRPWLSVGLLAGVGSIQCYSDLDVPTIYNQTARLLATVRPGADFLIARRYSILAYGAWERYGDGTQKLYPSVTVAVRL
jgi:hypothetical protein